MKLVTIEYLEINGRPNIVLFTRNNGQREMSIIKGFKPYFYVLSSEKKSDVIYKSIFGEKVVKVFAKVPQDVLQLRKNYDYTGEADVRFTSRYMIDCIPKIEKCNLRIQYTDIEKDIETNQIISISVFDNYLDKCVSFVWRANLENGIQYDKEYSFPSGYSFKATIHQYNSQVKMLTAYIRFVQKSNPDILSGWFFISYDMKELLQTMKVLGLQASRLSPINRAYIIGNEVGKFNQNIAVKGRVLWDMLKAYRWLQPSRLPDASLEAIAQKELGEGKVKRTMGFHELWQKDIEQLIEYNCKDSVLVLRIDQKKRLLEYFDELRRFIGCEWNALFSETLLWDVYILRKVHNKLVLPTKEKIIIPSYQGATVFEPASKGIHKNILLIDLKSLYPSIIITLNMSPETLYRGETPPNPDECYILPNGVAFYKKPVGLLPTILLELFERRKKLKLEMKKFPYGTSEYETLYNQQEAIKILCNALYGSMGYFNFRLATPEIASTIPYVGRKILEFIRDQLKKEGYNIIAGDTDSIFYKSKEEDLSKMVDEMFANCRTINDLTNIFIKDFGGSENSYIKIEPKKIYSAFMISEKKSGKGRAKKRYAGITPWADGEYVDINSKEALHIMGFEAKRSDSSELSRKVQRQVIKMLLMNNDIKIVKTYVNNIIDYIKNGGYTLEHIGIPKGLSMPLHKYKTDNPHRRGAIYSNHYLGTKFGMGDKPRIIYVMSCGKYPKTDVVAFNGDEEIPDDFKIDVDKMIEKTVIMKIEHILDTAGLTIENILYGTSSLEDFF